MNFTVKPIVCAVMAVSVLAGCGGDGGGSSDIPPSSVTPPTPTPDEKFYTDLETPEEVSRFLIQAGFGGTEAQIESLVGTDAADWLVEEFQKPSTPTLPIMLARYSTRQDTDANHSRVLWQTMLTADDVLRQRMMFALSQIFVISTDVFSNQGFSSAHYTDILVQNAFGNYSDVLEQVTYSPAMSEYLTYFQNQKADPDTGRMPDENYAREILQLFSIGLVELNLDGTPKTGSPETYTNEDITGLARVFTGLSGEGTAFRNRDLVEDYRHMPLKMYDEEHSPLEKRFLGTVIPENTGGSETISRALQTIFDHPNIAPFISHQLIQRFTASSPSSDYVQRVAEVFESGSYTAPNGQSFGQGTRGDFEAVLAAILLDETVHDDIEGTNEGKVREPVIKMIQYVKAFKVSDIDVFLETRFNDTSDVDDALAQHPFRSPSVFNFYRPGYVAPGSETGEIGLTAPELQIVNEGSSLGYINFMSHYIVSRSDTPEDYEGFFPNFDAEISLVDDPEMLVEHLNLKLTAGQLSEATKAEMIDVINSLPIDPNDAVVDRRKRAQAAIIMFMASGAYAVQN